MRSAAGWFPWEGNNALSRNYPRRKSSPARRTSKIGSTHIDTLPLLLSMCVLRHLKKGLYTPIN